jgi:hypothetical protein
MRNWEEVQFKEERLPLLKDSIIINVISHKQIQPKFNSKEKNQFLI